MSSRTLAHLLRLVTVFGATEYCRPESTRTLVEALRIVLERDPSDAEIEEFRASLLCYVESFGEGMPRPSAGPSS